jgi:hypothetical protein
MGNESLTDAKVHAAFARGFGEASSSLRLGSDKRFVQTIAAAFPALGQQEAFDLAFHLSDWRVDAAFLLALHLAPELFTADEIARGVTNFLVHAPNHVAAAAKIGDHPIADVFGLGVLDGDDDDDDRNASS